MKIKFFITAVLSLFIHTGFAQISYTAQFDQAEMTTPIMKKLHYQNMPRILAVITMKDTFLSSGVSDLQLFAPVHPALDRQQIDMQSTLTLTPAPAKSFPRIEPELSDLHDPVLVTYADLRNHPEGFVATLRVKATLKKIDLIDRKPGDPVIQVKPLTPIEKQLFLRNTPFYNFNDASFTTWLDANGLHPESTETRLDFAKRIYNYIQNHFTYFYKDTWNRSATHTIETGKTDCGGFSILFGSILRYHGIPARAMVGRWAGYGVNNKDCECHVKSEFYLQNIGWVPVDVTSGVLFKKDPADTQYFGTESGEFIVLHVDPELMLDTMYGPMKADFLQDFYYWVHTNKEFKDKISETWMVKRLDK